MKYIGIFWSYLCGLCYLLLLRFLPKRCLKGTNGSHHPQLVVSLTSYGRRVTQTVPYVIESLLVQTRTPDRIILWLDNDNFSDDCLPKKLSSLRDTYGVEIRYCEDLRSYKKLIPTLNLCPNDILVTVDDDLVYKRGLLESLYNAHIQTPGHILCALAHRPRLQGEDFAPYRCWMHNLTKPTVGMVFPLGGSGVLYPPHSLFVDVCDKDLFMRLAPQADDVWFWAMGVLAGTKVRMIDFGHPFYPIDLLYQKLHKNASLMSTNLHGDMNDVQIDAVKQHYPMFVEQLSVLYD